MSATSLLYSGFNLAVDDRSFCFGKSVQTTFNDRNKLV